MNAESGSFITESWHLCRLCLGNEQELLDIFGTQGESITAEPLTARISGVLQLQILQNDTLPKWICKQCLGIIDDFTSFREQCKENERKLLLGAEERVNAVANADDAAAGEEENGDGDDDDDGAGDEPTDDEETETIVIDPNRDYESSNESLPNDDHETEDNGDHFPPAPVTEQGRNAASEAEAEEDLIGSHPEDAEEEDEDEEEEDLKCDTFPKSATNGVAHGVSTNASVQKTSVFTCKYCDVAFAASSACQLHEMQDHDLLAPYACLYCAYKTAIRLSLIAHIRETHHITRPFICVQCNKGFPRRSDLKKHTFVHTGVRPYACDQCGKSFSRNTNLTKHMRIHSGFKPYNCDTCPRSFANRADLVRHNKIHSCQGSQFSCGRCGYTYARKDKLYNHERVCYRMHSTFDASSPPGGSRSGDMLQSYNPAMPFSLNFGQPMLGTIVKENPVPAPREPNPDPMVYGFANVAAPSTLKPPTTPSASSKIYTCTSCPKRFLSKASLRVHQASHTSIEVDTRNYECPQCRKQFTDKHEFEHHLVTHSDLKPFGCKVCGKKFSRRDKLQRHERVHQRERYFSCPHCTAKFQRSEALTSHLKIHCTPPASSVGNFLHLPPATASSAGIPYASSGQEQALMPHEHSMMYGVGDASAVIDSVRM